MISAPKQRLSLILALGTAQTLAWASSYYLVAILAVQMARDVGISSTEVYAAFSLSLLLTALIGPRVGRSIDDFGGRAVLIVSNVIFAGGLAVLGSALNPAMIWIGWMVMGLGMGLGLYDSAFATLSRIYGTEARSSITGVTLIAGFASTVGWPLTTWGEHDFGWRVTCFGWAIAHLLIALPLNAFIVPAVERRQAAPSARGEPKTHITMDMTMWLLGFAFAAGWTVSTAMAAHLPRLLELAGANQSQAVLAGALIGPAQVAARIAEAGLLNRFHPLLSARLSTLAHPIGAALLVVGGGWFTIAFSLLHGAGNGILTIARGTVPLTVYGPLNYGYRLGLIGAPARIAQAASPLAFGLLIDELGAATLFVSAAICLAATGALMLVKSTRGIE